MQKIKWGVIGAGGIADRRGIPGLLLASNAQLEAVMEINPGAAEALREKYGARSAYTDHEALIRDPDVQAVYIASPVGCHLEQILAAAAAGKHILVEKPIALSADQALEADAACSAAGIVAASGFMMRFGSWNRKIRELIQAGAIGPLVSCSAQFTCWYPDIPGAWRQAFATSGGGALMDMGIHCIDLIQFISGARATEVCAFTDTQTFSYEVDDAASLLMRLSSGAHAHVSAHFNIPDQAAAWKLEFYGTKGRITARDTIGQVDGGDADIIITAGNAQYNAQQDSPPCQRLDGVDVQFGNMYTRQFEDVSAAILAGSPVCCSMADGIQAQRVVEAAYLSAKQRRFVAV